MNEYVVKLDCRIDDAKGVTVMEIMGLIGKLQDQNVWVRVSAAEALVQIGTPEAIKAAVPALIETLRDQEWWVRGNSAVALGNIGSDAKDAVPALMQALQGQDEEVRGSVAETLKQIGTPEALKAVEKYRSRQ